MSAKPQAGARRIDHVSFVVEDLDTALRFYVDTLGLQIVKKEESELHGVRAAFLRAGDVMVEIIEPLSEGPLMEFLRKRGPGFHHLAFEVPDLPDALSVVSDAGYRVIDRKPKPGIEGGRISFLHPKDTFGAMTELCDKKEIERE
jgi:methylmalonyl-CoA/ethylmalonyl-CoA epimerase